MAEKVSIQKDLKLKQESIFDMGELYKLMYRWAKQHNYSDFIEDEYVEKISGETKNLEIAWTCIKKINDYVKAYIETKMYEFMGEVKSFLNLYKFRGIQ